MPTSVRNRVALIFLCKNFHKLKGKGVWGIVLCYGVVGIFIKIIFKNFKGIVFGGRKAKRRIHNAPPVFALPRAKGYNKAFVASAGKPYALVGFCGKIKDFALGIGAGAEAVIFKHTVCDFFKKRKIFYNNFFAFFFCGGRCK